jgi:hypothetical protein
VPVTARQVWMPMLSRSCGVNRSSTRLFSAMKRGTRFAPVHVLRWSYWVASRPSVKSIETRAPYEVPTPVSRPTRPPTRPL